MIEEADGYVVVNVQDAPWIENAGFGLRCSFEQDRKFPQTGVAIHVLEPGQPNCHYHRENAQEDFLVLSGECLLVVNGEERPLRAWDFVHCPPGVTHVFIGAGDGPCAILMIGHRPEERALFYPEHPLAAKHGAQTTEPTADPRVSYSKARPWGPGTAPTWPLECES